MNHWARAIRKCQLFEIFDQLGTLYPGMGWDDSEAELVREDCEKAGIPMGYGRVWNTPKQLNYSESVYQFRTRR